MTQGDYIAGIRKHWKKLVPYTDGVYINNMFNDDGDARVIKNWSTNYARLVELKNQYDPMNLLRVRKRPTKSGLRARLYDGMTTRWKVCL